MMVATFAAMLVVFVGGLQSGAQAGPQGRGPKVDGGEFPYGVAAYDVHPTKANLWTQTDVATKVRVEWTTDPAFGTIEGKLASLIPLNHGGTILLKVTGLSAGTTYYYRFVDTANDEMSRVATFKTAPASDADVAFTFDISGDQDGTLNPDTGQPCFNTFLTHQSVQADNPAFYINLGDTIYSDSKCKEQQGGIGDDVTLAQYRADHAFNVTYDRWRNLRGAVSMYSQWDDHEVRNDFNGDDVDQQLLKNGRKAFMEWEGVKKWDPKLGFYRTWTWGANAQFFLLDERSFRTQEAVRMDADGDTIPDCNDASTGAPDLAPTLVQSWRDYFASKFPGTGLDQPPPAQCTTDLFAADRTLLGVPQRKQFEKDLKASTATWKFVITEDQIQNFFALPYDRWEGYQWERDQVLHYIDDNAIKNVNWLATDIHAFMGHTVDFNTDTPGIGQTVQGMNEFSFGPVATDTFATELDNLLAPGCIGNACPHGMIRGFLVTVNKDFCASLIADGYGRITIDPGTHKLTMSARRDTGGGIGGTGGVNPDCQDYVALPQ
jgi:phosphodiesterase/alkaline phosphatase D-like protein